LLPDGRPWRDPGALGQMTLLHKTALASGEWHWATWLERLRIDARARRGGALARSLLVHDALHAGRLTLPVLGFEPMTSVKRHVARWRRSQAGDPDIRAFVDWMVEQAAQTMARTDAWLHAMLSAPPEPVRIARRERQRAAG